MSDKNTTATQDDLAKVERAVYNAFGVSQNMFNTDGNMALEKSVLSDEGITRTLLLQFEVFFDRIVQHWSSNKKKYNFRIYKTPEIENYVINVLKLKVDCDI